MDQHQLSPSDRGKRSQLTVEQSQYPSSPPSSPPSPCLTYPTTLSFPTLNLDGSVPHLDEISPQNTPRSYPATPPAALSTLGVKARMAETSLEAPYDMLEDLSDFSNDERETASLLSDSEEQDDTLTPEESVVDVRNEATVTLTPGRVAAQSTSNTVLESFLSEDLETPRQSYVQGFEHQNSPQSPASGSLFIQPYRVLFVSEHAVPDAVISDICLKIASGLLPRHQSVDESTVHFERLDTLDIEQDPHPAFLVRTGQVELVVYHCVAANFTQAGTTNKAGKHEQAITEDEIITTDLAIYYLQGQGYPGWFDSVVSHVSPSTPAVMIASPEVDLTLLSDDETFELDDRAQLFSHDAFFHGPDILLREVLEDVHQSFSEYRASQIPSTWKDKGAVFWKFVQSVNWNGWKYYIVIAATILSIIIKPYLERLDAIDLTTEIALRREALTVALSTVTNSTDVGTAFNISHLLPYPDASWPVDGLVPPSPAYQGAPPNHILISFPKNATSQANFPTVIATHVRNGDTSLEFNLTQLIPGVYDVTINEKDAAGKVIALLFTQNPCFEVTVEHDFGAGILSRKKYEKMTLEISKAINKDVMVARKNVKSLQKKVGLELTAGAAATKNVTTELAIYLARDLQVFVNTAVAVFAKAAVAGNETATTIKTELAIVRKDLVKFTTEVLAMANEIKALITPDLHDPLKLSMNRAKRIKSLLTRSKGTNSTSMTKELSLRLKNLFKSGREMKKGGILSDMARCSWSGKYKACRKAQRAGRAISSTASITSAWRGTELSNAGQAAETPVKKDVLSKPRDKVQVEPGKKGKKHGCSGSRKMSKMSEATDTKSTQSKTKAKLGRLL